MEKSHQKLLILKLVRFNLPLVTFHLNDNDHHIINIIIIDLFKIGLSLKWILFEQLCSLKLTKAEKEFIYK